MEKEQEQNSVQRDGVKMTKGVSEKAISGRGRGSERRHKSAKRVSFQGRQPSL